MKSTCFNVVCYHRKTQYTENTCTITAVQVSTTRSSNRGYVCVTGPNVATSPSLYLMTETLSVFESSWRQTILKVITENVYRNAPPSDAFRTWLSAYACVSEKPISIFRHIQSLRATKHGRRGAITNRLIEIKLVPNTPVGVWQFASVTSDTFHEKRDNALVK
jgi:hypothetical protein